ncbi:MAG: ABC transporter permease [Pseudonocardiaceae bacterium]|nr:ABC transporter permease [Pseudonocardiaceae bacterium]
MTTSVLPQTATDRLRWAVADGWTVTRRDLAHWVRQPGPVIFSLLFSVMIVLMFGYLFGGAMAMPGRAGGGQASGDYREFLMPGMFVMTMLFGVGETVSAVTADARKGVTDRFRAMPMAPSAVVVGRGTADMLNAILVLLVMIACGFAVGWRAHGGVPETVLAFVLVLLLRFALIWIGIYLGLIIKGEEGVTMVQTLEFPLGFLSSAFVAPSTMPGWLGAVAEWNPLSSTILATRELFGNPGWGGDSWITQHALLMAIVWPLLLVAIFFPLAVRRYAALGR